MEINRFEDVIGVVAQQDMVEGRFVTLVANTSEPTATENVDLPGAKLPATAEDAKRAKFCLTWAVDNRPAPIIDYPHASFDFRGGWVNSTAGPLTGVKMWLSHPGNQESQTIPSGYKALAFTEATVTIPSGQYIYNASLTVPGAAVMIADTASDSAADAGKPKYAASMAVGIIGFVQDYDTTTGALTIRIE
jgi:hypothetical protein